MVKYQYQETLMNKRNLEITVNAVSTMSCQLSGSHILLFLPMTEHAQANVLLMHADF